MKNRILKPGNIIQYYRSYGQVIMWLKSFKNKRLTGPHIIFPSNRKSILYEETFYHNGTYDYGVTRLKLIKKDATQQDWNKIKTVYIIL